jgi:hypothetical protein
MNDIDRKLKEKMKLFSDIDNTVNQHSNHIAYRKDINLPRKPNIAISDNKLSNKREDTQDKQNNLKPVSYNSGNNDIFSTKELTEGTRVVSTRGSKKDNCIKNCLIKTFTNDVGERLYHQAVRSREKLERRKQHEDDMRVKNMTPDITKKAKGIKRDPNRFEERLYPSHRIIGSVVYNDHSNKYYTIDNDTDDNSRIYQKKSKSKSPDYKFKPALNKYSIQLADKLEPAEQRLLKRKKRSKSCESLERSKSNKQVDMSRLEGLYTKGLTKIKSREAIHNEKKTIEDNEYKKYPYKPKINELSGNKLTPKKQEFHEKAYNWRKNIDVRINKERAIKEQQDQKELTFKPNLSKLNIATDEKFIMKNLSQIEDYVGKRRRSIALQKEHQEYVHKKFHPEENFTIKHTIPKEPNLHSSRTKRSRSNSPDVSIVRKEMRTENYFKRKTEENSYNNSIATSMSSVEDEKTNEFLKAVNNLQEKLLNFKF